MKRTTISLFLTSVVPLFFASSASAQDVDPAIQDLAEILAGEGFTDFTLEDPLFGSPTLVAEQDGVVLELELDPETFEVVDAVVAVDEDGDGEVSVEERRNAIAADELPEQASERAREAISVARERQLENSLRRDAEARERIAGAGGSNRGNGQTGVGASASAASNGNAGDNGNGGGNGNAGGNGNGGGNGNAGGNGNGGGNGNAGGNGRD
ncbi:hypothetical protein [Roseicyclus marinus]|uniref:hypothetical protein n=1 Tax=Roseicyclus marinus TaxID=2161673 RepID=UPI002410B0A8|nr:hypothetical protein [Roseicyclus marinus]MDG3042700.1 hypothetical protein [Roseicyclus marinus]